MTSFQTTHKKRIADDDAEKLDGFPSRVKTYTFSQGKQTAARGCSQSGLNSCLIKYFAGNAHRKVHST